MKKFYWIVRFAGSVIPCILADDNQLSYDLKKAIEFRTRREAREAAKMFMKDYKHLQPRVYKIHDRRKMSTDDFPYLRDLAYSLATAVEKLNDDQLKQLLDECQTVSTSNCWWMMYRMRELVAEQVRTVRENHATKTRGA